MKRRIVNAAAILSLLLCVGIATFLVAVVPALSPRNRSAGLQLERPITAGLTRTFDLCTYGRTVYLGSSVLDLDLRMGDPVSLPSTRPIPPTAARAGCSDFWWTAGARYDNAIGAAGQWWHGIGYACAEFPQMNEVRSAVVVALPVWIVVALSLVSSAIVGLRYRNVRRRGTMGCCPTCGYDLRATPERCPECGYAPQRLDG
jgi:hypothetical protein